MLGIAPGPTPAPAQANDPSSLRIASAQHKTMLGIAPQQPAQWQPAQQPLATSRPAASAPAPAPGVRGLPSQQKTMLGIAHPGIAPLNPTANKPGPVVPVVPDSPPASAFAPMAQPAGAVAGPSQEELSVLPENQRRRVPLVAILAIGGFVLLLLGVVVVALLWKSGGPLSARVTLDQQSKEQLELSCADCPDGTKASLDKASATFKNGRAVLPVARPLSMGDNDLRIALTRPGEHATTVELTVPVEYRVRGELGALAESPPKLRVTVQTVKGVSVSIDGKPLPLAADGTAHYDLDVTRELSGPANGVRLLEHKVPYSVQPPGVKKPDSGEITFQLGIVPLVIDAPGPSIVTDKQTFMLAGHTQKGGTVEVGNRPIKVDAQGSFAQLMNVSTVGQITINVRASAKDRAPRLFPLHVKRVASLSDEAAQFQKNATRSYAGIASSIGSKKGWAVALQGKVVESRVDHHRSYILLDVSRGCRHSPCLARLVYGASTRLGRGDRITAYGHITRGVDGPRSNDTIPEVGVEFFLKGPPP